MNDPMDRNPPQPGDLAFDPRVDEVRLRRQWRAIGARAPSRPRRLAPTRVGWGVAGAAAAIALVVAVWLGRSPEPSPGEGGALVLQDGSRVDLQAGATVQTVEETEREVVVRLVGGVADFDVSRRPERTFTVIAGPATIRVVGTRFRVSRVGEDVQVEVERGLVEVRAAGARDQLAAGQSWSSAEPETRITEAPPPGPEPVVDEPPFAEPRPEPPPSTREPVPEPRSPEPVSSDAVESARGLFEAARIARRSGRPRRAATLLAELVARFPDDARAPVAAFELGRLRLDALGEPLGAARAYELHLRLDPDSSFREDALAGVVLAYHRAERWEACETARSRYLAAFAGGVHAREVHGACH